MKILLVEDDLSQLRLLHTTLVQEKHIVDGIASGKEAQYLISYKDYDLIILDSILPSMSGVDLCRQYRQSGKKSPVLILMAHKAVADLVTGLDAGADDCLVKPVNTLEFLARVRALGRRSPLQGCNVLNLADLTLYIDNLILKRGNQTVQLSKREFQLMEYFLRHSHQILTHDQLEYALWENGYAPASNALSKLVGRLKKRLQSLDAGDWIESIYGIGYRLKALD